MKYFRWVAFALILHTPAFAANEFARGITVSSHTWGEEWALPQMAATLDELQGLGVTWIAIHPYAHIAADGSLRWDRDASPEYLVKPLRWARDRGLKVMLVPHIAYWGSPFLWRGEIQFDDAAGWQRFFHDYEGWINQIAEIGEANEADAFCVGLEYTHAVKFEDRWRRMISGIRQRFSGHLTYGANWDTYPDVPFWDVLDAIGVLAYFPLTKKPDPSVEDLLAGWERWMSDLDRLSSSTGKPVVFTEIGYNASAKAAAQPWDFHERGGVGAEEIQERLLEAALRLPSRYPFLKGMFFWKWFPRTDNERPETFDLRRPALEALLRQYWGEHRADAR